MMLLYNSVSLGDVTLQYYVDEVLRPQDINTLGNGKYYILSILTIWHYACIFCTDFH